MTYFYKHQLEILRSNLVDIKDKINLSFEFFPPKTNILEKIFWENIELLSSLQPNFFSITCNSNKGSSDITYHFAKKIQQKTKINTAPHLTCINLSITELNYIAEKYLKNNISHVIALRGDILKLRKNQMYAADLVKLLRKIGSFDISVAAYPEVHPEAKNANLDLINLKKKIDAGANRAITQFFFDTNKYLYFRDKCIKLGINVDIIPGILPIFNFTQIKKFAKMTNVKIPLWIHKLFCNLHKDIVSKKLIGFSIAIDMIKTLIKEGINNFHFYTLNCAELSYTISHILKI